MFRTDSFSVGKTSDWAKIYGGAKASDAKKNWNRQL